MNPEKLHHPMYPRAINLHHYKDVVIIIVIISAGKDRPKVGPFPKLGLARLPARSTTAPTTRLIANRDVDRDVSRGELLKQLGDSCDVFDLRAGIHCIEKTSGKSSKALALYESRYRCIPKL